MAEINGVHTGEAVIVNGGGRKIEKNQVARNRGSQLQPIYSSAATADCNTPNYMTNGSNSPSSSHTFQPRNNIVNHTSPTASAMSSYAPVNTSPANSTQTMDTTEKEKIASTMRPRPLQQPGMMTPSEMNPSESTPTEDWEAKRERTARLFKEKEKERQKLCFEQAYEEALRREKAPRTPPSVAFKLHCNTRFGQDVYLVGSDNALGDWNPHKAVPLMWTEGNIWVCSIPYSRDVDMWEFKFIKKEGGHVEWEKCNNRTIPQKVWKEKAIEIEVLWDRP